VSIGVGIGAGIKFGGGKIGLNIKGEPFTVDTRKGQTKVADAFNELRKKIEAAGYEVQVTSPPTIDSFLEAWSIKPAQRKVYDNMSYAELSGTLGAKDAEGFRLFKLDRKLQVGEHIVDQIRVQNGDRYAAGKATLDGRLDLHQLEIRIFPPQFEVRMTGSTNITAGEPHWDGKEFKNEKGQVLEQLRYANRQMQDGPSHTWVLDQSTDKAFYGNMAGGGPFVPPEVNHFSGFFKEFAIKTASRHDMQEVKFKLVSDTGTPGIDFPTDRPAPRAREEWPHNLANEPLVQVGGPLDDLVAKRWFMDEKSGKIYGFDITGPTSREMLQVIAKDPRDV
jgi:hypothetical protein